MRAMMARAHRDAFVVEQRREIVRMRALDEERDHRRLALGFAENAKARHRLQLRSRIDEELMLRRHDTLATERFHIVDRGAEPDKPRYVRRARFEAMRRIGERRAVETHFANH